MTHQENLIKLCKNLGKLVRLSFEEIIKRIFSQFFSE